MPELKYPPRKIEGAHRVDEELVVVLNQLMAENDPITVRAVTRRMCSIKQASSLTRDAWRMDRIKEAEDTRLKRSAQQSGLSTANAARSISLGEGPRGLRSFRYFVALARLGNFGRAARELKISQSALTQHTRSFEEGLGTQLFIRHSRGVTLTPAGSRLLETMDVVIPMLGASLSDEVELAANSRRLRLGVPSECASLVVPVFLDEFSKHWPNVQFDISEGTNFDVESALLARRIDFAILQDLCSVDELGIEPILTEELGLVCASSSAAADDLSALRIRDLTGLALILPGERHCVRRRIEALCIQHNVQLRPIFQVDSLQLRKELVRRWNAATVLPCVAAHDEILRGGLTFRPIAEPRLTVLNATAFNRAATSPAIALAISGLRASMTRLIGGAAWPRARMADARHEKCDLGTL